VINQREPTGSPRLSNVLTVLQQERITMCEPVSITMGVLAVAGAIAKTQADQQMADAQSKSNDAQYQTTMATYANNNAQSNLQGQQLREQTMQKIAENNINAEKGIGKATAASGTTGLAGNSVGALLGDLESNQARYNNSVETNYDNGVAGIENQRQNSWASTASNINGLKTPVQPDYMSAGLKVANQGATTYSQYGKTTTPTQAET